MNHDQYSSLIRTGIVVCLLTAGSAAALADDTRDRLDRLERDIQLLSKSVYRGEGGGAAQPQPLGGDMVSVGDTSLGGGLDYDRLNALEQLVRDLTGRIERQEFDNRQTIERLSALEQKINQTATPASESAVSDVTGSSPTLPPQPELTTPASSGPASLPVDDPATLYEQAYMAIQQGRHQEAQEAFQIFLDRFSDHALVPNARYWLAETHFARKNYGQATKLFAENYQADSKGPKAADNLLKLALSLSAQGKTKESCIALEQIGRDFPTAPPDIAGRVTEERTKLTCP